MEYELLEESLLIVTKQATNINKPNRKYYQMQLTVQLIICH